MIAIPNMEKPKNCYQCSFNDGIYCALIDNDTDAFIKDNPTEVATKVLPTCPLIEIVECKDCKHYITPYENIIDADGLCDNMQVLKDKNDYCSLGERRDDEN